MRGTRLDSQLPKLSIGLMSDRLHDHTLETPWEASLVYRSGSSFSNDDFLKRLMAQHCQRRCI